MGFQNNQNPFALSLSKGHSSFRKKEKASTGSARTGEKNVARALGEVGRSRKVLARKDLPCIGAVLGNAVH